MRNEEKSAYNNIQRKRREVATKKMKNEEFHHTDGHSSFFVLHSSLNQFFIEFRLHRSRRIFQKVPAGSRRFLHP